ncbi:hypothetical protein IJH16_03145 [Candidatus Saccharibacteria bacterium]|nr:hypothetical protein [Candidatus Saccharibacteria bacterium]
MIEIKAYEVEGLKERCVASLAGIYNLSKLVEQLKFHGYQVPTDVEEYFDWDRFIDEADINEAHFMVEGADAVIDGINKKVELLTKHAKAALFMCSQAEKQMLAHSFSTVKKFA